MTIWKMCPLQHTEGSVTCLSQSLALERRSIIRKSRYGKSVSVCLIVNATCEPSLRSSDCLVAWSKTASFAIHISIKKLQKLDDKSCVQPSWKKDRLSRKSTQETQCVWLIIERKHERSKILNWSFCPIGFSVSLDVFHRDSKTDDMEKLGGSQLQRLGCYLCHQC